MIRYITDEGAILESANYVLREIPVEPFYEVVNCESGKVLECSDSKHSRPYKRVGPYFNGERKTCGLHRLVLSTFDPNGYFPGADANHIDENKLNNKLSNLNWLSAKGNCNHGTRNQRVAESLKGVFINRKDLSKPVLQFTKSGEFVAEYPSLGEAERQTGTAHQHIGKCCNGKAKSAGGFVWKWKSSEE